MDCKKTRILYIAGCDRSGSTILDQILGKLPGWFTVGKLADFWQRGPLQLCGCGRVLKDIREAYWCRWNSRCKIP
jgi:hypothetical protein